MTRAPRPSVFASSAARYPYSNSTQHALRSGDGEDSEEEDLEDAGEDDRAVYHKYQPKVRGLDDRGERNDQGEFENGDGHRELEEGDYDRGEEAGEAGEFGEQVREDHLQSSNHPSKNPRNQYQQDEEAEFDGEGSVYEGEGQNDECGEGEGEGEHDEPIKINNTYYQRAGDEEEEEEEDGIFTQIVKKCRNVIAREPRPEGEDQSEQGGSESEYGGGDQGDGEEGEFEEEEEDVEMDQAQNTSNPANTIRNPSPTFSEVTRPQPRPPKVFITKNFSSTYPSGKQRRILLDNLDSDSEGEDFGEVQERQHPQEAEDLRNDHRAENEMQRMRTEDSQVDEMQQTNPEEQAELYQAEDDFQPAQADVPQQERDVELEKEIQAEHQADHRSRSRSQGIQAELGIDEFENGYPTRQNTQDYRDGDQLQQRIFENQAERAVGLQGKQAFKKPSRARIPAGRSASPPPRTRDHRHPPSQAERSPSPNANFRRSNARPQSPTRSQLQRDERSASPRARRPRGRSPSPRSSQHRSRSRSRSRSGTRSRSRTRSRSKDSAPRSVSPTRSHTLERRSLSADRNRSRSPASIPIESSVTTRRREYEGDRDRWNKYKHKVRAPIQGKSSANRERDRLRAETWEKEDRPGKGMTNRGGHGNLSRVLLGTEGKSQSQHRNAMNRENNKIKRTEGLGKSKNKARNHRKWLEKQKLQGAADIAEQGGGGEQHLGGDEVDEDMDGEGMDDEVDEDEGNLYY